MDLGEHLSSSEKRADASDELPYADRNFENSIWVK